jgi:hypothetical protein
MPDYLGRASPDVKPQWYPAVMVRRTISCVVLLVCVAGCGGGDGNDDNPPARKPDTGFGAAQPVPAPPTCTDLCTRLADCSAALCNEDTGSTRYDGLADILSANCDAMCADSSLTKITAAEWQCLFQSSCRQAIDYDTCGTGASYFCN